MTGLSDAAALGEIRVRDALLDGADAPDDRRVRLTEAEHGGRPELRAAEEREPRALPRRVAFASARDATTRLAVAAER